METPTRRLGRGGVEEFIVVVCSPQMASGGWMVAGTPVHDSRRGEINKVVHNIYTSFTKVA